MASVLKSESITKDSSVTRPIAFNVEDVQSRARQFLEETRRQAEQLLEDARAQADSIRQQAQQQGQAEAERQFDERVKEAATKLSDQRCKTAIASCQATVTQLEKQTGEWLATWRDQTVALAASIADKLLRKEMQHDQELLRVWLEEALVAFRESRELKIFVHPDDFAVAGRFLQALSKSVPQADSAEVIPDPEIQLGGCIVRSEHGQIDQQIESQLARLIAQLQ